MRKALCVVILLFIAFTAKAAIVDDFETYAVGAIPSPWVITASPATIGQEAGGNQYLQGYGSYRPLGSYSIPDSSTAKTVYFRVYKPSGYSQDCSAGLSHLSAPNGDWTNFEAYISIVGTDLKGRNNGVNTNLMTISDNTWYNIWLVLNNSANTYDIYVTMGDQAATPADKKTSTPFGFRNDAGDLVTFKVYGRTANGPIRIDDITILDPAVILEEPTDTAAHVNESAQYAVLFTSETQPMVSWYKAAYPADILMDPGQTNIDVALTYDEINQRYAATLALTDLAISDNGQYYCRVDNASGFPVNSEPAVLSVFGIVACWTFDQEDFISGQYTDIVGGQHAVAAGTPQFVEGADGIPNHSVQIAAGSGWASVDEFSASTTGQLTVSQWVKWQQTPQTSDDLAAASQSGGTITAVNGLNSSGQWQHICMVFDGTTGKLYIDGIMQAQGAFSLPADMTSLLQIGSSEAGADYFNGALDDLRAYNYAMTDAQVLAVYEEMAGGCGLSYDLSGPAGQPDCIVNIYDLVVFAGNWLLVYDFADFSGLSNTWLLNGP